MTNFKEGDSVFILRDHSLISLANAKIAIVPKLMKSGNFKIPGYDCQFRQTGSATGYQTITRAPHIVHATPEKVAERDSLIAVLLAKRSLKNMAEVLTYLAHSQIVDGDQYAATVKIESAIREAITPILEGMSDPRIAEIITHTTGRAM